MMVYADGWADVIAWNLRAAGALWAAWAGGASTMREAFEGDGEATMRRVGTIDWGGKTSKSKPKLELVP